MIKENVWQSTEIFMKSAEKMKEALLFGEIEAAYPLAYIYSNGLGNVKSVEQAALWLMIGKNLENETASELLGGIHKNKLYDMSHFLSKIGSIDRSILDEKALKYSQAVELNKIHCVFTEGLEESSITEAAVRFEATDPEHTLTVLGETGITADTGSSCGGCVIL